MTETIADVEISKPDKALFPEAGITKLDLCRYYQRIADHMLAHLRSRPLTLERYPDGINSNGFFQKSASDYFPDFVETVELPKENGTVTYVVCNSLQGLIYLANQGTIAFHTMLCAAEAPDHPLEMIFDLDPGKGDFASVRELALRLKEMLAERDYDARVKTTGGSGLHVVVPLDGEQTFAEVREEAAGIADTLAGEKSDIATTEVRKEKRGDRVYLDVARNAYGQTAVAAYSLRSTTGAPLAAPLEWQEVEDADLRADKYTISNIFRRLGQRDDPWG